MKVRDDKVYLRHILDSIEEIEVFLQGLTKEQFLKSALYQNATIRCLEVIGEATKQLTSETKSAAPSIPWQNIAGMRDMLIHHYFGVDLEAVWSTAQRDIPRLKTEVQRLLAASPLKGP